MELYAVTAQFGHVGRNKAIIKTIPVIAKNGKEAAFNVRWMGRAKHDKKDAILDVKKITQEEYEQIKLTNAEDGYFMAHSRQEQSILCPDIYEFAVTIKEAPQYDKFERRKRVSFKMKKEKLIKQSFNQHINMQIALA